MVLVSDKPRNAMDILQPQRRARQGHAARRLGLETLPLAPDGAGGHGAGEAGGQRRPAPVHDLLAMADAWPQREDRRHAPPGLPRAARPQVAVGGSARGGLAGRLTEDQPLG